MSSAETTLEEDQSDSSTRPTSALKMFGKHQVTAAVSTALDYLVMIVAVSGFGLGPVPGTVIGAAVGATTNFVLGRYWTFRAAGTGIHGQAFRYVVVSAFALGWNAAGEHLLAVMLGVQYILARLVVGTLVNVAWNFPLQRYFVFRR